jgi:pyrroloquinoline quinone biosynthesis protein B
VLLRILGSAAGGGFPQWNCGCATCWLARRDTPSVLPRTTCSIALSCRDGCWFLANAAAELNAQVAACPALWPPPGTRDTPVHGILLTDAELDHNLGLLAMRNAGQLHVYATRTVRTLLDEAGLSAILAAYTDLQWHDIEPGVPLRLRARDGSDAGIRCEAIPLGTGRLPRYAPDKAQRWDASRLAAAVVAYRITDTHLGGTALIMPAAPRIPAELLRGDDDLVVLDGTFWDDDELGLPGRSGTNLGHVPIGGPAGTLAMLRQRHAGGQRRPRIVYTHLNNTNPVLADGALRQLVADAGAEVACDGMEIRLGTGRPGDDRSNHEQHGVDAHADRIRGGAPPGMPGKVLAQPPVSP